MKKVKNDKPVKETGRFLRSGQRGNTYRKVYYPKSSLTSVDTVDGETIERKVERIVHNGDKITDGAPLNYTEKKDGVVAGYNIRTDRFEVAAEAMDAVHRSAEASSKEKAKMKVVKDDGDGKPESIEGSPDGGESKQKAD